MITRTDGKTKDGGKVRRKSDPAEILVSRREFLCRLSSHHGKSGSSVVEKVVVNGLDTERNLEGEEKVKEEKLVPHETGKNKVVHGVAPGVEEGIKWGEASLEGPVVVVLEDSVDVEVNKVKDEEGGGSGRKNYASPKGSMLVLRVKSI